MLGDRTGSEPHTYPSASHLLLFRHLSQGRKQSGLWAAFCQPCSLILLFFYGIFNISLPSHPSALSLLPVGRLLFEVLGLPSNPSSPLGIELNGVDIEETDRTVLWVMTALKDRRIDWRNSAALWVWLSVRNGAFGDAQAAAHVGLSFLSMKTCRNFHYWWKSQLKLAIL